jgi:hypothetical protein
VKTDSIFVSFEKRDDRYIASLFLEQYGSIKVDAEILLRRAENTYKKSISEMKSKIEAIKNYRLRNIRTPARAIWLLGDSIFKLTSDLERLSLQINDLYTHLQRDLEVKRKWLEKVIIFRRYIPEVGFIPNELNWGKCEKGTRKVAEALKNGTYVIEGVTHKDGKLRSSKDF